jgi:peptide chain release factor 1
MTEKLEGLLRRHRELSILITDPGLTRDPKQYKAVMQEFNQLEEVNAAWREIEALKAQRTEAQSMLADPDPDLKAMAREELKELEPRVAEAESNLNLLLIPRDPLDDKNTIMEIRAGTGGEEAGLFAADLFRMYSRYAEKKGWRLEIISESPTELGGLKEIIFSLSGKKVFGTMRWESGGHRVQRVPATENAGRIHTSACTVAVMPEAEETDIVLNDNEIRIDVFRSSGPGGQSVNTTDSAVRITHLPSGLVVQCQDEKSQIKNKAKAMMVLKARLFELEESKRLAEQSEARKAMIGSGDRSERIRTYNFPQNRLTDHRINLTLYHLDRIIEGGLDEVVQPLLVSIQEAELKNLG